MQILDGDIDLLGRVVLSESEVARQRLARDQHRHILTDDANVIAVFERERKHLAAHSERLIHRSARPVDLGGQGRTEGNTGKIYTGDTADPTRDARWENEEESLTLRDAEEGRAAIAELDGDVLRGHANDISTGGRPARDLLECEVAADHLTRDA